MSLREFLQKYLNIFGFISLDECLEKTGTKDKYEQAKFLKTVRFGKKK